MWGQGQENIIKNRLPVMFFLMEIILLHQESMFYRNFREKSYGSFIMQCLVLVGLAVDLWFAFPV